MSTAAAELSKQYRPAEHESRIRGRWEAARAFHADPSRVLDGLAKPYCIVIPPPNVTDRLHLGHALNNTLQDILVRYHRMLGDETLWMPGTDHAGIATQAVVERRLLKDEKKRREDLGRDEFVRRVQQFKDEYEATITGQLKAMGCSCDWDRQRFTMDPQCTAAVREAFFRFFRDGLIYRGKRLVNWDPVLRTAVADDECYDEEIDGKFYYLKYPLVTPVKLPGGEGVDHVTVATTRPETYLGDTAVAMNPKDPRAKALVGLQVTLPLVGRVIPIIADDYVVLPEAMATTDEQKADPKAQDPKAKFATGFLKVTPAHDVNDYEIGQRHKLAAVNIFAPDASISDKHGWADVGGAREFVGLKRDAARKAVVEKLSGMGLVADVKPYRHSVKHSDRSKAIIEPYLSDQWYVKVTDDRLAGSALHALAPEQRGGTPPSRGGHDGLLSFHPERYAKTYVLWHENIRDWCISRQLWWGHRIPVWSLSAGDLEALGTKWANIAKQSEGVAVDWSGLRSPSPTLHVCLRKEMPQVERELAADGFTQDSDVLDTWFSSALWPMSTMGWPDQNAPLLEAFNPTSTLCTAREIITLWVSRMVMFNRYLRGQDLGPAPGEGPPPFADVFIHALIMDGDGRKMSKSIGNGVDPLDIIESHGADAMRFTLCHMTTQTQDVRLPVAKDAATGKNTSPKFDLGRNFANKLWNAGRLGLSVLGTPEDAATSTQPRSLVNRWMLSRLARGAAEVERAIAGYEFHAYAQAMYDLVWRDFCDWYLEAIKPFASSREHREVLRVSLETILRLLHPVMPFVTEAIYEPLRGLPLPAIRGAVLGPMAKGDLLCLAAWPRLESSLIDAKAEEEFAHLQALITAVREVRAQHKVGVKERPTLHASLKLEAASQDLVLRLAGLEKISAQPPQGPAVAFRVGELELALSRPEQAGVDGGAERDRLTKLLAEQEKAIATLQGRLDSPSYTQRAPANLVQQTRDQLAKAQEQRAATLAALEKLGGAAS